MSRLVNAMCWDIDVPEYRFRGVSWLWPVALGRSILCMRNMDELIKKIKKTVDSHRLEQEGEYARYLWQNEAGNRKMGLNEYGCADAANILYTINDFVEEPEKRQAWVKT